MNDKSILEGLFRQHYGKMIHLARTLLHDEAEAQDVVQDVFARLLENKYQMTGSKTEAYLMSAVRNGCLNHIRKMQLRERFKHIQPLDEADDTRPIEEVLAELDQINAIVEEQIEEPQRSIFRLRFDEELTFQEIATRLDMSVGGVYKYLRQCINRIKSLI
jgi:RNA polymerase sigma factor (sigma-70 family)